MPRVISRSRVYFVRCANGKADGSVQGANEGFVPGRSEVSGRLAAVWYLSLFRLDSFRGQIGNGDLLNRLRSRVEAFDPTLGSALEKSQAKILYQLTKIEGKVARELFIATVELLMMRISSMRP